MAEPDELQARPEVAIFRHNLFRVSEPFITQQAEQLQRFRPLYLGRMRFGAAPAGARSLTLHDGGPVRTLPGIGWQLLSRDARPYTRLLAAHHPVLIHAHFGVEGVYALPLAARLGVPLVTTFHGFDATLSTAALLLSPAWANYPLFRRRLACRGALFLAASAFIRDRLLALGFPEARTRVHHIGVDCGTIRPRRPDEATRTILHVARLVEVKGAAFLIRAFAALPPRHADVELVIIGDGPLRRPLRKLAAALGVAPRVRFLGALPHAQALAWMRRAAMLVLPSVRTASGRVEGLGMVALEAAASGVPVVGSRLGGIPEAVADGATGFLVPERDTDALARRMIDLLDSGTARIAMGAAGRALIERRFDIRVQTAALETLYDEALAGRPAP